MIAASERMLASSCIDKFRTRFCSEKQIIGCL
jgi:hypothetical protein